MRKRDEDDPLTPLRCQAMAVYDEVWEPHPVLADLRVKAEWEVRHASAVVLLTLIAKRWRSEPSGSSTWSGYRYAQRLNENGKPEDKL